MLTAEKKGASAGGGVAAERTSRSSNFASLIEGQHTTRLLVRLFMAVSFMVDLVIDLQTKTARLLAVSNRSLLDGNRDALLNEKSRKRCARFLAHHGHVTYRRPAVRGEQTQTHHVNKGLGPPIRIASSFSSIAKGKPASKRSQPFLRISADDQARVDNGDLPRYRGANDLAFPGID
jgi:hypothetical protein